MALRYTSPLSRFLTDKFVWEETSKYPHYHFHIHLKIPNSGLAYNLPSCPCWTEAPQPMAQNGSKHSPGEPGPSEERAHCDLSCLAMSPSREQPRGAKPSHSGVRLRGVSEEASLGLLQRTRCVHCSSPESQPAWVHPWETSSPGFRHSHGGRSLVAFREGQRCLVNVFTSQDAGRVTQHLLGFAP